MRILGLYFNIINYSFILLKKLHTSLHIKILHFILPVCFAAGYKGFEFGKVLVIFVLDFSLLRTYSHHGNLSMFPSIIILLNHMLVKILPFALSSLNSVFIFLDIVWLCLQVAGLIILF